MVVGLTRSTTTYGQVMFIMLSIYLVVGLALLALTIGIVIRTIHKVVPRLPR